MGGRPGPSSPETTAALKNHVDCRQNKTPKLPNNPGLKKGTSIANFEIVFGSFTEEESKPLQPALPPVKRVLPKRAVSKPLFGVDDFPELGTFRTSDPPISTLGELSRRNCAALIPNAQAGWTGILGRAPEAATAGAVKQ